MFGRKRLLSALLAGVMAVSSLGITAFAADDEDEDETIMTFDGQYDMDETVEYDFIYTAGNSYEVQEKLDNAIMKATGVKDLDDLTFAHLAKVKTLNLSDLELEDVPTCINYMVNLTKLDLSSNLLQSEALKKLSLVGCTKLSNINLSNNYLISVPSWFVSDRVSTGNITQNFVDSSNPRSIEATITTYYLMDGEVFDENNLKNQILKSIRMNNGKLLPEIFFEYNSYDPPYPAEDEDYPYDLDVVNWESFTVPVGEDPDGDKMVKAPENKTITVTVKLFKDVENDNTKTTVTIYLLSGKDLTSLKLRLQGLMDECGDLSKDEYTESSWTKFTQAKDTADAILKYEKADIQMLTSAFNALNKARDDLDYGTNELQAMLKGLIAVGGTYKQENYTPSSWTAFSKALEKLKKIASDKDARLETAQSAVKSFQRAQEGLTSAELRVPDKILKSDFEKIFGDDKSITAAGITQAGSSYKWTFYGKDLQDVADFNPEVKETDSNESKILLEAGSSSGHKMFATTEKNALPGKATLELDVSDKFSSGEFYLYKWNGNRSQMAGKATVKDGKAAIPLTEGGVYYISRKIQNFDLKSSKYEVDNEKKTVTVPPTLGVNAYDFKKTFDFADYTTILDADGKAVTSYSNMKTGMTINAPNMDKFTVVITGDVDGSGGVDFEDVVSLIDVFLNGVAEGDSTTYDIDGDGSVTFEDVNQAITYFLMVI